MSKTTIFNPETHALAVYKKEGKLKPFTFNRRHLRENDVAVRILYAGVCHTDIHTIKNQANRPLDYPLVLGHEIMGQVIDVGSKVSNLKKGDQVLIGVQVDSCRVCEHCKAEREIYCVAFPTTTYGTKDRVDGTPNQGGFSTQYVADEHFVFKMPQGMDASRSAPLMCAGATVFAPLSQWKAGPGKTVGVVGIGGLGHLAVKYARAMGAHVVAFTTSESKIEEIKKLGAHEVVYSKDLQHIQAKRETIDLMIDTVSSVYTMDPYIWTVKFDGVYSSLGAPGRLDFDPISLMLGRRILTSSAGGGSTLLREMLEFSAKNNIYPKVEFIKPDYLNTALQRLEKGDVRYRFVMDLTDGM